MAVALRGSAGVPNGNPTTSFNITLDAAIQTDDVLFVAVTSRDHSGVTARVSVSDDGGGNAWALMTGAESADRKASVWWKRATAGTAGATLSVSGAVGSVSGVVKAFSGAIAAGDPFTNVVAESNISGNETHATFTPSNDNGAICASIHNYANDNAVTSLSSANFGAMTTTEKLSTGGSDCATAFGHDDHTTGATGSITWAQTNGTTHSITWAIRAATSITLAPDPVVFDMNPVAPVVVALSAYAELVLADGPAAYWRLGEPSGTTAVDEVGSTDGTYQATPTLGVAGALDGESDTAVQLDGSTEYISVPDGAVPDLGDVFSLEAWVKRDATGSQMAIITKGPGAYMMWFDGADFRLTRQDIAHIVTATSTPTDTTDWHHYVATKNGSAVKLYIDGADVTGSVSDSTMVDTTDELNIGRRVNSNNIHLDGSIDEVAIYDFVLTPTQVLEHYVQGAGVEPIELTPAVVVIDFNPVAPTLGLVKTLAPASFGVDLHPVIVGISKVLTLTPAPVAIDVNPVAPVVSNDLPATTLTPDPVAIDVNPVAPGLAHVLALAPAAVVIDFNPVSPALALSLVLAPAPVAVLVALPESIFRYDIVLSPAPVVFVVTANGVVEVALAVGGDPLMTLTSKARPRYPWNRGAFPRR